MEHDEWRLGDEGEPGTCSACGKRNRAGQTVCVICGTRLGTSGEDAAHLRTLGEAIAGERTRRLTRRASRERWWLWPSAALSLFVVVVGLYWWMNVRELPPGLESTVVAPSTAPLPVIAARPTAVVPRRTAQPLEHANVPPRPAPAATEDVSALAPRPAASTRPPAVRRAVQRTVAPRVAVETTPAVATAIKPPPPAAAPAIESPARVPSAIEPPPAAPSAIEPPSPAVESPPSAASAIEPPVSPPFQEKPSLGTDLAEARQAYVAAVRTYNARADEYNAIADEYQQLDSEAAPERAAELRAQLDLARAAAEQAQTVAEEMQTRMERVRSQYR